MCSQIQHLRQECRWQRCMALPYNFDFVGGWKKIKSGIILTVFNLLTILASGKSCFSQACSRKNSWDVYISWSKTLRSRYVYDSTRKTVPSTICVAKTPKKKIVTLSSTFLGASSIISTKVFVLQSKRTVCQRFDFWAKLKLQTSSIILTSYSC